MTTLFLILIILASVILSMVVLIQNPKGGGLAGNIAGFSNQFMGVKQTTDVLEKGTWLFAGIIAVLCLAASFFIKGNSSNNFNRVREAGQGVVPNQQTPPANNPANAPFQQQQQQQLPPASPDTTR